MPRQHIKKTVSRTTAGKKTTQKTPAKTIEKKKPLKKAASKEIAKKTPPKPAEIVDTAIELTVGMRAPAFDLPATIIGKVSLAKMKHQIFILYFYPKDETSGCTAEACAFRDAMPRLGKLGVKVIGISKDSLDSHEKFAHKFDLDFPLASDESGKVCEAYGVWIEKSMYGRKYMGIDRATFLIDGRGIVRAVWRHVSVPGHVDAVRKTLLSLNEG